MTLHNDNVQQDVLSIANWELQSSFTLVKGKQTVIAESPARVELMVSDAE